MEIPIQNIYYLLCYAWNQLDERDIVDVRRIESNKIVDLFAKVLINGITHLIKRGIYRGYLNCSEEIRTIRGKLQINNSIKRNLFTTGKADCNYDELDHNITHNKILKTTLYLLINSNEINDDLRSELIKIYRYFHQINFITLSSKVFRHAQIHRNNYFYLFLLNICEIIYECMLTSEDSGQTKFKDFLRDEGKMAGLFEKFVRNFYKLEQTDYKVGSEIINWNITTSASYLIPELRTDISLTSKTKKIIIDTKYYKDAFQKNFNAQKFRSGHISQIYAYVKQAEYKDDIGKNSEGILVYPFVESHIDFAGEIEGHKIKILTINLNQDWQLIKRDLLNIIHS